MKNEQKKGRGSFRKPATILLAVKCCVLTVSLMTATASDADIGAVTAVRGNASVKRPGIDQKLQATRGLAVKVGDVVQTGRDGTCQLALTDDSFFTLGSSAAIRVNQYSFDEKEDRRSAIVQILEGRVRTVIFKPRAQGSRFRVETDTAAIDPEPLADFVVIANPKITEVIVIQRGIRVRNRTPLYVGEVRLRENGRSSVRERQSPLPQEIVSLAERHALLKAFE